MTGAGGLSVRLARSRQLIFSHDRSRRAPVEVIVHTGADNVAVELSAGLARAETGDAEGI